MSNGVLRAARSVSVDQSEYEVGIYNYVAVSSKGPLPEFKLVGDRRVPGNGMICVLQVVVFRSFPSKGIGTAGSTGDDDDVFFGEGDRGLTDDLKNYFAVSEGISPTGSDDANSKFSGHYSIIPQSQFSLSSFSDFSKCLAARVSVRAFRKSAERAAA
jgi:hypothetical protein